MAALKREMMLKNKANARKRNEEFLKKRLEQLNIDERKADARREEAEKLKYLEECTKFAQKKNNKMFASSDSRTMRRTT